MKPEDVIKKPKVGLNIDTQQIKETVLNFVVPLIAVSISILTLLLFVYPSYKNVPVKKLELEGKVTLDRTLNAKYTNLKKLVDFQSVLNEDAAIVNKVLVSEAEVPKLLDQVNQIADNSGIALNRLSYSYGSTSSGGAADPTGANLSIVSVSLAGDLNYEQMIVFMESVENASRFLKVSTFRYSKAQVTSGEEGNLSGSFSIDSPYLFVQSTAVTDEPLDLDISSSDFVSFLNMLRSLRYYEFINQNIEAEEEKVEENKEEVVEETPVENTEEVEVTPSE